MAPSKVFWKNYLILVIRRIVYLNREKKVHFKHKIYIFCLKVIKFRKPIVSPEDNGEKI